MLGVFPISIGPVSFIYHQYGMAENIKYHPIFINKRMLFLKINAQHDQGSCFHKS